MSTGPSQSGKTVVRRVVVVGGGLAGIAAAAALHSAGIEVTLIEARRELGGRASSFQDAQTGELLDNCQHVLLGCCTNLLDLYRRLGVAEKIQWQRTVHYLDADGREFNLWAVGGLPAPLHLGLSMSLFSALNVRDRIAMTRAMLAMLRMGRSGREKLEGVTFGQWLKEFHQSDRLIQRFYDPVLISALNEETRSVSGKYAIQVFQDAMLAHRRGYVVGLPGCPLEQLYANRPCPDVRLNTRVDEILFERNRAVGVKLTSGDQLTADAVVLAVNHHAVTRWIPEFLQAIDGRFGGLEKLETVPILGVHLWFDRPVMRRGHAALFEGPLQWLFRKDADGRVLHGVISAAREWATTPHAQAIELFEKQLGRLFSASGAKLVRSRIIVEKRATFSPLPGSDALRPLQRPPTDGIAGLFLAGDYTRTDWPATMEGAVRSGYLAAEAVVKALQPDGPEAQFLVPDLSPEWPARLLTRN